MLICAKTKKNSMYLFINKYFNYTKKIFQLKVYYKFNSKIKISRFTFNKLKRVNQHKRELQTVLFDNHSIEFTSPFWFLHSIEEIFVNEVYKFISVKKEPIIIDCGANIGLSILYFKQLNKNSKIIAFEADPIVYSSLEKNIKQYSYNNIELINAAVWNEETKLIFKSEGSVGGRISTDKESTKFDFEVKAVRLRKYLSSKVDFLKIDIEGAEFNVIKDCSDLLINIENLFLEYHVLQNEEQKLQEILSWISKAGFKYYIREAWNNMTYPFLKSYNDSYQMQLNIFCYRETIKDDKE